MFCLGIETSCDETGLSIVQDGVLLGQNMASQISMHAVFGGVVPELASREHYRVLGPLLEDLLQTTGCRLEQMDAVAVARGPGLLGSLLVGLALAKGLCLSTGSELVGVDHLMAHLLAPGLEQPLQFPALGLLVSGGHTQLRLMRSEVEHEVLGRTLDDAVGEAFDKMAKLVNLPYPGGMYIGGLAGQAEPDTGMFPRPYLDNQNLDFSFSGLKTAVSSYVAQHPSVRLPGLSDKPEISDIARQSPELSMVCASFNWSAVQALAVKVKRALARCPSVKALVVAGGVAANSLLRRVMAEVAEEAGVRLILPSQPLCTDNAAMIAFAGQLLHDRGLRHSLSLEAIPRGRPIPWDYLGRVS